MTVPRDALHRLCEHVGIAAGFRDIWGRDHETSDETRIALLKAMGVIADESEVAQALRSREEGAWRRRIPAVCVLREDELPCRWEICLDERTAGKALTWTLALESGETRRGELRAVELAETGRREIGGTTFIRFDFQWRDALPPGYHRFILGPPDASDAAAMTLIVVPRRCYTSPGLDAGGRVWGPALQLYAVRSGHNWGIGDFTDLRNAVDIMARLGAGVVGLNPLHALFPHNPSHISPYSPSSRVYLNPLYIDVEAVPEFAACRAARERTADPQFQARLRALRSAELVDYPGLAGAKLGVLRAVYREFRERDVAAGTDRGSAYTRFILEGGETLTRFALYHALQEKFHAEDAGIWGWSVWPEAYRRPDSPEVRSYLEANRDGVEFYAWLQWLADEQLAACGQRALELGLTVGLYQDLAVSVDRAGAEAWAWQELYAETASVGSPPDDFNLHGQNWGLPPVIPERLTEAGYAPFIATLRANMRHSGALRIDHVMGLTRLFWVPPDASPEEGAYVTYPLHDLLGIVALESQRNRCMVIGEDLGTLPEGLGENLEAAGVLSYRLLLFEKQADGSFKAPAAYPKQALAAASTHDLPTLKSFWRGHDLDVRAQLNLYPSEGQRAQQVMERSQDRARLLIALERGGLLPPGMSVHPVSTPDMTPEFTLAIHSFIARSRAQLMMVQMEDVFGQLEQVNLPATSDQYPNWQRKLALNLEEWGADDRVKALAEAMKAERGIGARAFAAAAAALPDAAPIIPRATYRLQFNRDFTFARATELVPYLAALGVSHVYCSPYLKARPGSLHGYDIIDHGALNPEIGSEEDFDRFVAALKRHGMGQVLDMVPNHMGVMGADNGYWLDVLENGPASVHAEVFDIEWNPAKEGIEGKVVVPALAEPYGRVLERGELKLVFDAERGEFSVWYFEHRFPVNPRQYRRILGRAPERLDARLGAEHPDVLEFKSLITAFQNLPPRTAVQPEKLAERRRDKEVHKRHLAGLVARSPDIAWFVGQAVKEVNGIPGDSLSFAELHALLEAQAYRLAFWRVASAEINYRRFFDINDLAALRMENPEVFDFTHALVLRLLSEGKVDGLRIDHPDGLFDPLQYFHRLQYRRAQVPTDLPAESAPYRSTYVVVEKILEAEERLPSEWPVHGTTGYDFMNLLNGLFLDAAAGARLERFYRIFTRDPLPADEILYRSKRIIMRTALAGELNVLANALARIAEADHHTRDFTLNNLRNALFEVVACFPVYRTYLAPGRVTEDDRRHVQLAVEAAKRRSTAGDVSVFGFVREAMLTSIADGKTEAFRRQVLTFAMKLQQYTAPVTAKGMEDTTFYIYNRLISLNEVGGDPRRFGVTLTTFHRANRERQKNWPHAMLATSTHDNKRSEDVRARLNVLSEIPEEWRANVIRWNRISREKKGRAGAERAPSPNDEYFLYQCLVGAWPLGELDEAGLSAFRERIRETMLKAVREAKVLTSWMNPNAAYEEATLGFVDALLAPGSGNAFLDEFLPFQRKIARIGLMNSVSQVVLKTTAPGVPDFYQGNESWDFSLVDPDNRRPVDYGRRVAWLAEMQRAAAHGPEVLRSYAAELFGTAGDGRLKLYVTWRLLQLRRRFDAVFREGEYAPLRARGPRANNVCAFVRRQGDLQLVVIAPRWFARLASTGLAAVGDAVWHDTELEAPRGDWLNVLTGESVSTTQADGALPLVRVFSTLPWAVLAPSGTIIDTAQRAQ
ncbi:MAG TPA: malto-oligosyltrehalose synthase [Burkholderiales bacterium]|nr:malto-oligosyltrehalose synthase [Burkholderiales bacterium]